MIYTDQINSFSVPIDLIPFGGVTSAEGTIAWPPDRDIVMTIRVASPGLTLLKLEAWGDRGQETDKDAADFYRLLTTYADAGNIDRLFEEELDLLEAAGFDLDLAGAELLGRDVAAITSLPVMEHYGLC